MASRRSSSLIGVAVLSALGCGESRITPLGAPQLVLSEINLGGADRVATRVASDLTFGQTVMDGIATGDSLWLEVARNLPLKSAATEANFAIALAAALPRNPRGVLALIGAKTPVGDVCSIPFLKTNPELVQSYYEGAVAALAGARTDSLAEVAQDCAVALAAARERKLARIDSAYLVKNKPVVPKPVPRRRRNR
jgi:hypothetical protein